MNEPLGPATQSRRILVTGGAGFIGSALVHQLIAESPHYVSVLDAMTYAAVPASLALVRDNMRFGFTQADIADTTTVGKLLRSFEPDAVVHLAAETHVDRSIDGPSAFVQTNVVGTVSLLQSILDWWREHNPTRRAAFRFLHVSTDEVFGTLDSTGRFDETTPYDPRSPYAASKAASDHFVRAWGHTWGLPVMISNCSNNYGPRQYPEKLIPLLILRALAGETLPIYGDGDHVRDWLHVEDHARALRTVLERGQPGRTYAAGGDAERTNLEVARVVCRALDRQAPRADGVGHETQITLVADRPGHDRRYAIDATRLGDELGWRSSVTFADGIEATVAWYLANRDWWEPVIRKGAMDRRGSG